MYISVFLVHFLHINIFYKNKKLYNSHKKIRKFVKNYHIVKYLSPEWNTQISFLWEGKT